MNSTGRRLLFVHAHPDDETITTGATIARYVAEGAQVAVVTCTLGEEGDILVPALNRLSSKDGDQLGGYRLHEMAAAMGELGVQDHRWLGGAGRFRDSGMAGWASMEHPRAFWRCDYDPDVFDEAAGYLAEIIRELRPDAVITYDPNGGYGHPDHIMTHRVTTEAFARAAEPGARLYWVIAPRAALEAELAHAADLAPEHLARVTPDDLPSTADAETTTVVNGQRYVIRQMAALEKHATQATVYGQCYALSNDIARYASGIEYFRRVQGDAVGPAREDGLEDGLFESDSAR